MLMQEPIEKNEWSEIQSDSRKLDSLALSTFLISLEGRLNEDIHSHVSIVASSELFEKKEHLSSIKALAEYICKKMPGE